MAIGNMEDFYAQLRAENVLDYGRKTEHLDILSDLYTDDSHFIYEILQNAEDAQASEVKFVLYPDRLEIFHDGKRAFNEEDVKSITKISDSTKREDVNTTGKFGLGFKSVYAVTDAPEIHSGGYDFKIESLIRPYPVSSIGIHAPYSTLFILPFKIEKQKQVYSKLAQKLQQLELKTVLFLENIKAISWEIKGATFNKNAGTYLKENKRNSQYGFNEVTCLDEKHIEKWFVFSSGTKNDCFVQLAFLYDEEHDEIIPANNTDLVVLFPTEKETGLNFVVNGNFQTTPARDNVPPEKEHNRQLIECIEELLKRVVPELKNKGLMNISLMKTLPTDASRFMSDKMVFFKPIYDTTKELFKTEELIPTNIEGIYAKSTELAYARNSELTELYTPFNKKWLTTEITHQNKNKDLYDYLTDELDVPMVIPEQFCRDCLSREFLSTQTDDWFKKLYAFLTDQKALWKENDAPRGRGSNAGIVRSRFIIKLDNDELVTPDDGAFLPTENLDPDYRTVKHVFVEDKTSYDFLTRLGLKQPNKVDALEKNILQKYMTNVVIGDEEYKKDVKNIISILQASDITDSEKQRVRSYPIIKCQDGLFRKPEEVYINSEQLKIWFANQDRFFVANICSDAEWLALGVNYLPKIITKHLKNTEIPSAIKKYTTHEDELVTYDLDGLRDLKITEENAVVVSKIIYDRYKHSNGIDVFKGGRYSYFYYSPCTNYVDTEIYAKLQSTPWVLTNENKLDIPKNIPTSSLNTEVLFLEELPSYMFSKDVCDEAVKMIESAGKKCIIPEDEDEDAFLREQQKLYRNNKKNNSEDTNNEQDVTEEGNWTPEKNADEVEISRVDLTPMDENRGNLGTVSKTANVDNEEEKAKTTSKRLSAADKQRIGAEGEEYVKRSLIKDEHFEESEIIILNTDEENSTGRDIEVKKNGELIKHIEVKSTTELPTNRHVFEMSGKQWAAARKYQDKYWLYCVFGVGKEATIVAVQNPIQKWKDGELEVHPVDIVVGIKNT